MNTIQVSAFHQESALAMADVRRSYAASAEVEPETAMAIASWWQSPGSVGKQLAAFASGVEVNKAVLLADIHQTRVHEGYYNGDMNDDDKLALDMLATFVINYT